MFARAIAKATTKAPVRMMSTDIKRIPMYINGQFVESTSTKVIEVRDPSTGKVIAHCPESTTEELDAATAAAAEAFKTWKNVPMVQRQRVIFKLRDLIIKNEQEFVDAIIAESGKTTADAKGSIFRGLEAIESTAASIPHAFGKSLQQVADCVDVTTVRAPIGVVASIMPFNFSVMLLGWLMPALVLGNTLVHKTSERIPTPALILARLLKEAGLPDGVFNIVHGAHHTVNYMCDEPRIKAISFVGSNQAGEYIHDRASKNGKRVQANLGAKNHCLIMNDANKDVALKQLATSFIGGTGQRCMALSVAIFVGDAKEWIPEVVEISKQFKCGDKNSDFGPLIAQPNLDRANALIESAVKQGATILLDGRNPTHVDSSMSGGYWMDPTVITGVTTDMDCYKEEIFAPVLCIMTVDTIEEGLEIINNNPWGNGASIFTESGSSARKFTYECEAGQLGVNVPIPLAAAHFSFTGNKKSFRGTHHFYGEEGVHFHTSLKTITTNWRINERHDNITTAFPTNKK